MGRLKNAVIKMSLDIDNKYYLPYDPKMYSNSSLYYAARLHQVKSEIRFQYEYQISNAIFKETSTRITDPK